MRDLARAFLRLIAALAMGLVSLAAQAQPSLLFSHVQHFYAGGGGCAERFWLEWENAAAKITDIEVQVELRSESDEALSQMLRVARLGTTTADRASEVLLETPRCLSGRPSIVVRQASATAGGRRIDLLQSGQLRAGQTKRYPVSIGTPRRRPGELR
ncbi:MAG: hypothetical protein H6R10_794 [Rhodocyclaceae bacterium]|nr:hypothetical protein [Rhodocyclaceae bacterium]